MPSTREIAIVSLAGIVATLAVAALLDLGAYPTVLVACAISLNYWAVRGLWKYRRDRVIRVEDDERVLNDRDL